MSSDLGKKTPRKAKPTFGYAIFSVTLILLLVGSLYTIFFGFNKALIEIRESIEIEVELQPDISQAGIDSLKQILASKPYINTMTFNSKEEAVKNFEKELNQDIVGIAGFNPLYDAYIITLKNEFSDPDSVRAISASLSEISGIKGINYSSAVMELVNANIKKLTTIGSVAVFFLLIIAFSLIDNTIRLMMFSQRFIIRSMQLIGATKGFIIKPFILRGVTAGLISGIIAVGIIGGSIYYIQNRFELLKLVQQDYINLGIMGIILILIGIVICLLSTYLSVNKYLRMKLDELY